LVAAPETFGLSGLAALAADLAIAVVLLEEITVGTFMVVDGYLRYTKGKRDSILINARFRVYSAALVAFSVVAAGFAFAVPNPFEVEALIVLIVLSTVIVLMAVGRFIVFIQRARASRAGEETQEHAQPPAPRQ
jgi:hypothetical protein